jgi:hypothetical protein
MYLDLIIIVFVVILSFVLCMNDKTYGCQMSHILIGLSVVVLYKIANYISKTNTYFTSNKTEHFANDNLTQAINEFISGTTIQPLDTEQIKSLTQEQYAEYANKLAEFNRRIADLQNTVSNPQSNVIGMQSDMTSLDLASQQQYQMFQIDYLARQIKNAQQIISSKAIADSSSNYKPIKVLSSCSISGTEGKTVPEQPVSSGSTTDKTSLDQMLTTITQSRTNTGDNIFSSIIQKVIDSQTQ